MTFEIDLRGSTALVTGGGQGVGRAVCTTLAAAGARVIVNDFVPERAVAAAAELVATGADATAAAFDVSDFDAVQAAFAGAEVDILINNAGNGGPPIIAPGADRSDASSWQPAPVGLGAFAESEPAQWDRYFAVNMFGVMYCTRAALPHMIERRAGRIVTVISEAGRWGEANMAPYAAAKAGAAGFTRAIAREVGRHGITANNVALATIDTMGLAERAADDAEFKARIDKQLGHYIVRRLGQPDDVAGLITLLASPLASWITGQTYPVNGGYTVNQ
jgi:NAD(P)-dependent dehydrogenase (short-subunit alcohol dehydrogenase family)